MPLELGMAIACQKTLFPSHRWFVFESKQRRIQKSMSDLDGTDVHTHRGRPAAVFSELTNAFVRSWRQASVGQMRRVFAGLKKRTAQADAGCRHEILFHSPRLRGSTSASAKAQRSVRYLIRLIAQPNSSPGTFGPIRGQPNRTYSNGYCFANLRGFNLQS